MICKATHTPALTAVPGIGIPGPLMTVHSDFISKTLTSALSDHMGFLTEKISDLFLHIWTGGKAELKGSLSSCLAKVLTPFFISQPYPDLPARYKAMLLSALEGAELFFADLEQALGPKRSCFEADSIFQLQSGQHDAQALEDEIIEKMNISLRRLSLQPIIPQPHDLGDLENNLSKVTTNLLKALFPSLQKNSLEREAVNVVTGLYLSKAADFLFSPFTTLLLLDKLLNGSFLIDIKIAKFPTFPGAKLDREFAGNLDERFQKLIKHVVNLGSAGVVHHCLLACLIPLVLYSTKGVLGASCAKAIQTTVQSPSSASILAWCIDLVYRNSNEGRAKIPVLLKRASDRDLLMLQYKYHIEKAIREDKLFGKINALIKGALSEQGPEVSLERRLLFSAGRMLVVDATMIKSLCRQLTKKLYILLQRERLLKMLYCYVAGSACRAVNSL